MTLHITDFVKSSIVSRQKGVSLIEAMVATLMLAVLFLGLAHVLARGLVSQRYVNTHNLALMEIREVLQTSGVCTGSHSLSLIEEITLETDCPSRNAVTISVATLSPVSLATGDLPPVINVSTGSDSTTQGLFGGDGNIFVSSN